MIVTKCDWCNEETFYTLGEDKGCINYECKFIDWSFANNYMDIMETILYQKLGFCGCGAPEKCLLFIKQFLDLKENREEKNIDWDSYYILQKELFDKSQDALMWIVDYMLDDKRITTHGGNVSGSWIDDKEFKKLIDLYVEKINKTEE